MVHMRYGLNGVKGEPMTKNCPLCGASPSQQKRKATGRAEDINGLCFVSKCHYKPDSIQVAFDEDDNEIETDEAYSDGCDYSCSICGYTMLGGEIGWFEETEGKYGGWNYKPRFNYCPNCGAEVIK